VELVVEPNIGGHEKAELTADSQQRKRKAGHSDEAPQPKRIRLVTPPHGPNCACGQLVALSAYRLAGKSVINKARECNLAMSDAHLFLDDSVPMTDTVAMMMGSTSVCTHAFCHTSHQAQLLRGALSRVPQEKMVFLDQDCKNQKRKFDIFDKAPPGTVLANRLVLGPVLATADKSSRAVFAVASAPRGMVKSDTKRYVCKIDFPTEDTVRHEIVSLTMLQDLTPHVVRLESVFSVRRHPVIGDATAIVMERLDWTVVDLMRARSSRPSQRVAFVLIRALEAAAAIHQCMHRIGAFNCDIRSANMGAFISSECLVPKLDAHCCPCEKHARRGLGVRIFDTG
ncbi:MAG: protein kinase family protein, partial [Betaproteobacteria bacterium]|nr:protein kinase family protein [Betaproteobacteria bacterium]